MQVAVVELIEHRFNRIVVVRKRLAHTGGQARIIDELTQAVACKRQVI